MNSHKTKLIDGSFSLEDAKSVLLEMISYKISHHQKKKHSNEERFGADTDHSEKRIVELSTERQELNAWFSTLGKDARVRITGNIEIVQE
jgi:hypothetical protein